MRGCLATSVRNLCGAAIRFEACSLRVCVGGGCQVYFPYLLINKKRYAGLYWTTPDKPDMLDAKGIETVRRDNCTLVTTVLNRTLDLLLKERNLQGAVDYVKEVGRRRWTRGGGFSLSVRPDRLWMYRQTQTTQTC